MTGNATGNETVADAADTGTGRVADGARTQAARQGIEELRQKLLDLSSGNKLLNLTWDATP